jgi:type IX secretion system PorP/SprF family membrane protein
MRLFIIILSFFICDQFKGQQTVQFTQYIFNGFAINPALAGSKPCIDVKLGYRAQWLGFEGAPKTTFASVNGELKFKKVKTIRTKHGAGVYVESDVIGPVKKTTMYLAYAYHFPLFRGVTASLGVFAGLQELRLNASKISVFDGNDPLIRGSGARFMIPDVSPGFFVSHKDWFTGFSIRQAFPKTWGLIGSDKTKNTLHYLLVGGKRFETGNAINVVPSGMLKWTGYTNPSLDLNLLFELNHYFEIGASWRNGDALAGIVKINFLEYFSLGYSFDLTTSKIRLGSSNTHEIILGIYSCSRGASDYLCPAFN